MIQFLNEVTSITMLNSQASAIEDAIETFEQLFKATPAACRQDLELLAEALTNLKIINAKIEHEEGFEMLYKLYRRETLENG